MEGGNDFFLEIILPVIIMGAAKDVDLKLMYKNFNYIFLYGVIGTLLNFIGLFCFLFIFAEIFNLKLLDHSNCGINSIAALGYADRH